MRARSSLCCKGESIIEVAIIVAIIGVLASLGFASYRSLKAKYDLIYAAHKIYADMEWCREKSMGSAHGYGLYFGINSYKVFLDTNDNGKFDNGEEVKGGSFSHIALSVSNTNVSNNGYIYSRRGSPVASFTLTITDEYSHTKYIRVSMFKTRIE